MQKPLEWEKSEVRVGCALILTEGEIVTGGSLILIRMNVVMERKRNLWQRARTAEELHVEYFTTTKQRGREKSYGDKITKAHILFILFSLKNIKETRAYAVPGALNKLSE